MEASPIMEFDEDRKGVLDPAERFKPGKLPPRLVLTFFTPALLKLFRRVESREGHVLESFGGSPHPVRVVEWEGKEIGLFASGIGAPLAAGYLEELIALGARDILVCGGAGVLDSSICQGHLILPDAALRDEGLSHHYLPAGREVGPHPEALEALERVLLARRAPYLRGKTWTTDGLYRETRDRVRRRREEGALCVEMEAAALFAVAQYRGARCAQVLYGGDDVGGETWDHRGWQKNWGVQEMLLEICLEAVAGMH